MLWLGLLGLVVWLVLQPSWLPKVPNLRPDLERALQRAETGANSLYSDLRGRLRLPHRADTRAQKFKQWLTNQTVSQELELYDRLPAHAQGMTAWLSTLSDNEMHEFTEKVAAFTASLGLDLNWLMENRVNAYPALKQAIEEAVALYSISAWRAYNVQQDVKAFRAYQAWESNPARHRALGQRVYGALVQQGLISTDPELYLAPEKERNAAAVRAIQEVAASKPEAVTAIMREWVTAPDAAKLQTVPQSAS